MNQILADNMKQYIKDQLKFDRRCQFHFDWNGSGFCHFLTDPGCGHYGKRIDLPFEQRNEFYRCVL